MGSKHTLRLQTGRHRDDLIWKLYLQCGGQRSFPDFTKDILYELALSIMKGSDAGIIALGLSSNTSEPTKPRSKAKPKSYKKKDTKPSIKPESAECDKDDRYSTEQDTTGMDKDNLDEQVDGEVPATSIIKAGF